MSGWAGVGWNLAFWVAAVLVACNYRDAAWRIHSFITNTSGSNRLLTPVVIRFTCGALATVRW